MTDTLESSPVDDARRHREILDRARMGLADDLDDLRQELADELEAFEARLHQISARLPTWLDLPGESLRAPFELEIPPGEQQTLIGPRTVAMIAGQVEDFFVDWLGDADTIPAWEKRRDPEAKKALGRKLAALDELMDTARTAVDDLADDGPLQLEQLLESIVFELQTRRETDVEAIKSMIQDGDIEPGRDARAEIAELWEEQRARADKLQLVWDDILNLHHEGIARTLEGIGELQQLTARARQGIEGAGIELGAADTTDADEAAPSGEESTDDEDSRPVDDEPPQPDDDPQQPNGEYREVRSETEEQLPTVPDATDGVGAAKSSSDIESNPFLRSPSDVEESDAEEADKTPEEPDDDGKSEESSPPEDTQKDEAGDTDLAAAPPSDEAGPTQPSFAFEDSATEPDDAPLDAESQPESTALSDTVDLSGQPADDDVSADDEFSPSPPPESSENVPAEDASPSEKVRVRTYRIREGWKTVTGDEIAVALGAPGLVIAVLFVLCLLSLVGLADNPMVMWDGALLTTVYLLMGVLVALPLVFRWRPMWRGHRFQVIRRGDIEEEVDLRITAGRLFLDRTSWPLEKIQDAKIERWEFGNDNATGWILTFTPLYHAPIHLATYTSDHTVWQQSNANLRTPPDDAWQLPPDEFHTVRRSLGIELD